MCNEIPCELCIKFDDLKKIPTLSYLKGKPHDPMFSFLDIIPERNGQSDEWMALACS